MKKIFFTYIVVTLSLLLVSLPIEANNTSPTIESQGAILMDGDTGQILYQKDAHTAYAPASITKLMTALLTLENLAPDEEITLSRNAVLSIERGSSHIGLREGEIITVENALHGLLLNSANEVANGLAENIGGSIDGFALMMTDRAAELGATNTNFLNPHGLYKEAHVTSAYDMALITKELLTHDYFLEVMSHPKWQIPETNVVDEIRYLHQSHKLLNPYKDPSRYREDTIAGKSGYTVLSGYTLVTVSRRDQRTLIAVSLKTDANHLYSDTNALLDYGFEAFHSTTITPSAYTTVLPIMEGQTAAGEATVTLSGPMTLQLPISIDKDRIELIPTLPESLALTSALGDTSGEVAFEYGGQSLGTQSLIISDIQLTSTLEVQTPSLKTSVDNPEEVPESKKTYKWLVWLLIVLLIVSFSGYLIYLAKVNTISYKTYKNRRDTEKT